MNKTTAGTEEQDESLGILTPRQLAFCLEYARAINGKQAAIAAGYSPRGAKETASRLLTFANIRAKIKALRAKAEDAAVMSMKEAAQRLTEIGRGELPDFINPDGTATVDAPNQAAIQVLDIDKDGRVTRLRLRDPIRTIEALARLLGWYNEPPPDPEEEAQQIDDFLAGARAATGLPPK